jgi:hypothetical protein
MFKYTKSMMKDFRFPFDGLETIEENYSQALQDLFVLSVLNGEHDGTFLEIGGFHPEFLSNSLLLERDFGYSGITIDLDSSVESQFKAYGRKCKFITADATKLDYNVVLSSFDKPIISYLQIDIEPNIQSLNCLRIIPFDNFDFKTISFEHDNYDPNQSKDVNDAIRKESEEILELNGYIAVAKNIENMGSDEFESWWISPKYVDKETITKFMLKDVNKPIRAKDYMLKCS